MTAIVDGLSWLLLIAGSIWIILGGIGLLRFPDFYTRLHPVGLTDTMGAALLLLGLMLQAGWTLVALKLAMILLILFFTSPTSGHATARAALAAGLKPWRNPAAGASIKQDGDAC